jgi:hypothetical protein
MTPPEPSFVLSQLETGSPLWAKLTGHFQRRIEDLRAQLEGDRTDSATASLRGRIAEIRAIMSLNEVPAAPE